jgi:hypothetical protein
MNVFMHQAFHIDLHILKRLPAYPVGQNQLC